MAGDGYLKSPVPPPLVPVLCNVNDVLIENAHHTCHSTQEHGAKQPQMSPWSYELKQSLFLEVVSVRSLATVTPMVCK